MRFADILEAHWSGSCRKAVLSCRTPRRGGHRHHCAGCGRDFFLYHSCNHRSCPTCGSLEQRQWAARQEARLLPVAYHLVTITVPDPLRRLMLRHPRELYTILFKAGSEALRDLCRNPRHLGGDIGFVAVLHTWTRRMLHHPHLHILVPAVALAPGGCSLRHPRSEEYLVPQRALAGIGVRRILSHLESLFG